MGHHLTRRALVVAFAAWSLLAAGCTFEWPQFGHDPRHSGLTGETRVGADEAANLGLKWQVNTGQPVYASPVVAFNVALGKRLVYVGNDGGIMSAYDAGNGCSGCGGAKPGPYINSTASVVNGIVYFGSSDKKLYAVGRCHRGHSVHVHARVADRLVTGRWPTRTATGWSSTSVTTA